MTYRSAVIFVLCAAAARLPAQTVHQVESHTRGNTIALVVANASAAQVAGLVTVSVARHPAYIAFSEKERSMHAIAVGDEATITFMFDVGRSISAGKVDTVEFLISDRSGTVAKKEILVTVAMPVEFALRQNYPNPFNPLTTIEYQLPVNCRVRLKVYDVLGRDVETLVDEQQEAGYKEAHFHTSRVASGVYLYRLEASPLAGGIAFVSMKKMMLLK